MKLDSDQKALLGCPIITAACVTGVVVPVCTAVNRHNPAWLMLWLATGVLVGVMCAGLKHWQNK